MKKIFTRLFALFLLSFVTTDAWAQITFTVDPSKGSYSGTGTYCTGWTSNSEDYPETKISVSVNNMATSPASSSSFEIATGQTSPSTWYLMVDGCRILSYSFKCKLKDSTSSITVTAGDNSYVMTTEEQTVEVSGLDNVQKASFQLSGDNKHLVVTELTFTASPILEEGCVYMFENARADRSLRADGADDVHTKATDANDTAQQWYVTKENGYYILRNVAYGKYLKGASSSGTGWSLTDDYSAAENKFELHISNSTLNTLKTKDSDSYGYMHDDTNEDNGGCNVVGWLNGDGNTGSHWTITKVDYTAEQITALLEKAPTVAEIEAWGVNFLKLFNDAACLDPAFGTLEAAQESEDYKSLSSDLQALVNDIYTKCLSDNWAEDNADAAKHEEGLDWEHKYAKKFRVQMYEPYSIAGDITSWLGINAHANNDNPTGIYVPEAGTLYVMVEGTINDGASLRIVDGGHNWRVTNATGGGYALKPGLNVINYTAAAGHLYICYNVDTYNPDGATTAEKFPHKLSDYAPLKIHIEGGAINGYYNACGDFRASAPGAADDLWYQYSGASVDCDADWEYMETRANLSVLPLLAHRQILLFQLEDCNSDKGMKTLLPDLLDVPTTPYNNTKNWADYGMGCDPSTGKINIMLEAWDRIMYSELATMGLVSQSTMAQMNAFYPRWESDYTIKYEMYDYENKSEIDGKTYLEFCGVDYSDVFNHHGVALGTESGYMYGGWDHCGYHINTFGGIVQNMANNAGSTWGPAHEIGHQHQAPLTLNGLTEVTNNLFSNIALWYKGMSTSRYNGDNGSLESVLNAYNTEGSDIYTNNIWALTHLYYRLWLYYHLAGNNTQFYPRLFELLRQQPMQKGYNVSGDVSTLHFYKLACQAAGEDLTEFFRAHGYFSIMDDRLVGDYSNSVYEVSQEMIDEAIAEVKEMGYEENLAIIFICDDDENATYVQHDGVTKRDIYGETTPNSDFGSVSDFINGDVSVEAAYTATVSADGTVTMSGGEGGVGFLLLNEKGEVISFSNKSEFSLSDEAKEAIMSGSATFVTVDAESATSTVNVDLAAIQKDILGTLIAKAQPIIDKIDTTYTKIGFYKGAAVADLAEVLAYAKEVYAGSSGYEAAYDLLYAELKKVEANPDAKIPFDPSLTYIITNYAYPSRTMTVVNNVVYANTGVDTTADAAKWQFKETATAGVYNVYNCSGIYCGTISGSTAVATTTEQASASNYTIDNLGDGLWAISLNPSGTNTQFHAAANDSYKVVGWNTSGNATKWYLTAVEPNATIADLTNLEVYINKTEALLNEVLGTVTYTRGENITLQTTASGNPNYIWSNAPEDSSEGNIANLVDGATDNYFHTEWSSEPPSGTHYIAVDLGEGNTLTRFAFSHTTRSGATNDFPKSVDVYGSDDNVTYKYLGSASGMPQTAGTAWQYEGVMVASHRYLRFNVHANRGYWHMAEFDIMPVTGFTATVNDTYSDTVTVKAVTAAMEALLNGKSVAFSMSPTKETIDSVLEVLETAYKALYTEYEAAITARKNTLAQLVTETNELIDQVGTVQLSEVTPVELKESNFYCNAPYIASQNADYSAEYVSKLTDGNNSTYLHTRWNANSDDGDFHYLRVDAGDTPIDLFQFTYTTANRTKKDMPLTMVVEGANEIDGVVTTKDESFTQIAELTPLPEVLNDNTVYKSEVLGSAGTKYRYLRFKVTDITVDESDGNGHPFFTMAEFGISSVVEEKVTVNESYKSNVSDNLLLSSVLVTNSSDSVSKNPLVTSVPLLDAQIADQQAAKDKLYAAMNNTAALKENLMKLIDDTQALYGKMATDEGAVNEYYSTSSLTAANLSEALTEIEDAQTVYDNSSATVDEIKTAFDELNVKYGVLYGIEELNVAADARTDITGLIEKMEELLGEVADKTTAKTAIALQTTDANAEFYIWSNATAWDCNGIGALIDKNDDGTAKTGTFFGTTWDSGTTVNNYDHYITVDLGTDIALSELSFDYTTRNSDHSNQRPTSIKISASNDKEGEYIEIATLSEGMPVGQCAKWEMLSAVALNSYYRYIRFAVATEVGYFNMSDFNLYAHSAVKANDNYSTSDITTAQLFAMNAALLDGIAARDNYVTEENYNAALTVLQEQYNELLAIKNANVSDRNSLADLITETNTLIEEVATVSEEEAAIAMQCTDENASYYLYCNAPGKTNNYDGDDKGVTALLDNDSGTFLHTTYYGDDYDDDLDHYLRLDMGKDKALVSFKFNYVGRVGNTGNAPKTIVVEGSNDRENFEEITTLSALPTANNATYQSDVITNGKAYRYIRFMVKETSNGSKYKEHQYFALSQFAVTACKTIEVKTEYVSPNLPLSTLVTANNEVVDATVIKNQFYVTETVYNTTKEELQAAYDALNLAKNLKELPVILTTDVNNPVLYKIRINRSALKVLAIDDSDAKVPVEDFVRDDDTQSWYFMQGTDGESYEDIHIFPYWYNGAANTTLRLGAASAGNAAGTVTAVEGTDATNTIQNWYITTASDTEEGWWNIQPEGKTNYFSNNGGIANKMGFWNSASDNGSEFQFLLDGPYTDLSIIFGSVVARQPEYNAPGYYANAADYNAVYDIASGYVTNANGTDEQYTAALDNLIAAETALSDGDRVPSDALEDGAVYRIMNLITNTAAGYEYHYIQNSSATIAFPTTPAVDDNSCLWVCKANSDGTYEFVSALGTLSLGWKEGSENAQAFTIADGVVTGAKCMKNSSNVRMALTNEKYGSLAFNHASNGEVQSSNWSTDWYFDKIDDADVKFNVNISSRRFSSLYLPYDVEVPEGVGAFTAVAVDGTAVELVRVADKLDSSRHGTVVPARTPVILYIEDVDVTPAGSFEFAYTTDEANLPDDVKANVDAAIIHGHILKTPILCENSYRYYKLGGKSGDTVSKMYWMWKEYGSDGVIADGNAGTDKGGYISCSANKIYMKVAETLAANSFSMRFGADSGTTGIDGLSDQSAKDREIYDLQGRKLSEITEPGIYIVNGKKVYVK